MIFPEELFNNSYEALFNKVSVQSKALYAIILISLVGAIVSLPFIVVDVSVQANGIIRPIAEKFDVRFPVSGKINFVAIEENQKIHKDSLIFSLSTDILDNEINENQRLQNEYQVWLNDLRLLVALDTNTVFNDLNISPTYREQYLHLVYQLRNNRDAYRKAAKDLAVDEGLLASKAISRRDYEDKKLTVNELQTNFSRILKRQQAEWLEELHSWNSKLNALKLKEQNFQKDKKLYSVYSPISGTIQGLTGKYQGQFVQAGEQFCTVSPDSMLIAECLVYPKDIAFVHKDQKTYIQIDAFNYNQWGFLEGKVIDVADDFTLIDGMPTFKVRCLLDRTHLSLRNGFKGNLKKGMTLRARFVVTQRSLFQLLYDKVDNWLNPLQKGDD